MARRTLILCAAASAAAASLAIANAGTVPGPEAKDLLKQIAGYVLEARGDQIAVLSLPDGKQTVLRPIRAENASDFPDIHTLSGPDRDGRIAYIEDHSAKHLLKSIRVDGSGDTTIFSRPGAATSATAASVRGMIGQYLALSPVGSRVAFLSALSDRQMPGALYSQGTIEVWSIIKKQRLTSEVGAVDQPTSWFPDGRKLAFVRFVDRGTVPKKGIQVGDLFPENYRQSWKELLAVHVLDIDSGHTEFLSLGEVPVVSADGKTVFVGSWVPLASPKGTGETQLLWKRVEIATGKVADVTWPYAHGFEEANGLIANPRDDLVLYWGLPTAGAPIKRSSEGSFRAGMALVTIKVAILNSNRFQTVVPDIDRRHPVSFGPAPKNQSQLERDSASPSTSR
jgi:WD40 repeat protein